VGEEEEVDTCLCILLVFVCSRQRGTVNMEQGQGPREAGAEGPLAPPVWKVAAPASASSPACTHEHMHRTSQLNGSKQQAAEPMALSYVTILHREYTNCSESIKGG
jgi:hypothetical protein